MKPFFALFLLGIAVSGISAQQKPDVSRCVAMVDPKSCPTFTEATMTRKMCSTMAPSMLPAWIQKVPSTTISNKGITRRMTAAHATAACREQDAALISGSPMSVASTTKTMCWDGEKEVEGTYFTSLGCCKDQPKPVKDCFQEAAAAWRAAKAAQGGK